MNRRLNHILLCCLIAILLLGTSCLLCACGGAESTEQSDVTSEAATPEDPPEEPAAEPETEPAQTEPAETEPVETETAPLLTTLFLASDYQPEEGWSSPRKTLRGVMEAAKEDGQVPEGLLFCGDYSESRVQHDYQTPPDDAIQEIRENVKEIFPTVKDESMVFVQGNHDTLTDAITPTGLYEYDNYLVYVLNTENDFPWKQGKVAGSLKKVKRASREMKRCFDQLIARGETRPVFIAGHVPLHFTSKTSSRHTTGDNLYSSLVFDVVNEAARSLDIVYLFGHNHSKGWDCYLGGSSVYKAVGDKIIIPVYKETERTTDKYVRKKLRFTYLNTGYVGFYMNCGFEELERGEVPDYAAADGTLTGTVCRIYRDRMVFTRYSVQGIHPLGWKGAPDPYDDYIDVGLIKKKDYSKKNTESPQTVKRRAG